jgi:hypothetical protein
MDPGDADSSQPSPHALVIERLHASTKEFFSGCGEEIWGELYEDILNFERAPLFILSEGVDGVSAYVAQAPAWLTLIRADFLQSLQALLAMQAGWAVQFCSARDDVNADVWVTSAAIRVGVRSASANSLSADIDAWRQLEQAQIEQEIGALQRQVARVSLLLRDRDENADSKRPIQLVAVFDYRGNDNGHTSIWLRYHEADTHFVLQQSPSSRGLNLIAASDGKIVGADDSPGLKEIMLKEYILKRSLTSDEALLQFREHLNSQRKREGRVARWIEIPLDHETILTRDQVE